KKDSKKIKKKSKKRSKSKKSKQSVEDTVTKEAASSQMPETDITSPKLTLATEATAIDVDQPNIVPPISEEKVEKPVMKAEPKVEKKDSKKIKKRSKKRSKSKKSKKSVEDTVDDDRAVRFNLANLIQMWRQSLNQDAFPSKLTVINWLSVCSALSRDEMLG
ncbi:hypothetical protein T07_1335, partial [Trichinella nelsoni]